MDTVSYGTRDTENNGYRNKYHAILKFELERKRVNWIPWSSVPACAAAGMVTVLVGKDAYMSVAC